MPIGRRTGWKGSAARPIAPCQTFSNGNVYKKRRDPRHSLPRKYARLLKDLNRHYGLDFFVFENVVELKHRDHKELFSDLKGLFREAGFTIFEDVLDAKDFGVPQTRRSVSHISPMVT